MVGRDVAQIDTVVKSGIDIIIVDNPHANRFTIHILAAVAEEQQRTISVNTKAALRAAKQRGIQLGKYGKTLSFENKQKAKMFVKGMLPIITTLATEGITTIRAIARELNTRKVPTFRTGAQWHIKSVQNLL